MKITLAIVLAVASFVAAVPCNHHENGCSSENKEELQGGITPSVETEKGSFACANDGNSVLQHDGTQWVKHVCPKDLKCMPDIYTCVGLDVYDAIYEQVHSSSGSSGSGNLSAPPLASEGGACVTGEFQCSSRGDVLQCNHESWVVWPCMEGTQCVPNDFECVPVGDEWDRVFSQMNPPKTETSSLLSAPTPTLSIPEPPTDVCVNGSFECFSGHVLQCNLGTWILWPCMEGTQCVPNDFECVPVGEEWNRVYEQMNPSKEH